MNKFLHSISWVATSLVVIACSTASVRVMPGTDGLHKAAARDLELEGAEEAAVEAAQKYCEKQNREAQFVKSDSQYTGSMDESTRNTIRKGSHAAMVVGGVGTIPEASRTAGGIVSGAGLVGHMMTSDRDYLAEVSFRCGQHSR